MFARAGSRLGIKSLICSLIVSTVIGVLGTPASAALSPTRVEAETYTKAAGVVKQPTYVGFIDGYDWIRYDNVDLTNYTDLAVYASIVKANAKIDVMMDATDDGINISGGTKIAMMAGTTPDPNATTYSLRKLPLMFKASGKHTLYFRFLNNNGGTLPGIGNLDWFELSRTPSSEASLKQVTVGQQASLQPAFTPNSTAYTVVVYDDVPIVELTPQVTDTGFANISINGAQQVDGAPYPLPTAQASSAVVTVTAENGNQKVYTFTVERRQLLSTYYVSLQGTDAGDGSAQQPWKTLSYACDHVPTNRGVTIQLAEGTYEENTTCSLPSGVSIAGAGMTKTIIKPKVTHDMNGAAWNYDDAKFAIHVRDTANVSFHDFKLDGKIEETVRAHGGLFIKKGENLLIHDVEMDDFDFSGLWMTEISNAKLYNSVFLKKGFIGENTWNRTGNVMFGKLTDVDMHDLFVREDRGADGIATMEYGWRQQPYNQFPNQDWYIDLYRVKMYNLDVDVRQKGLWGNGQPGIAIELWGTDINDVEISHSIFSDNLSMAGKNSNGTQSVRIHHNQFLADPAGPNGYTYSTEIISPFAEIDHNYFHNGYYPIADFSSDTKEGIRVHHNVFDHNEGIDFLHFRGGLKNSQFTNNVVIIGDNLRDFDKGKLAFATLGKVSDGLVVKNNIFQNVGKITNQGTFIGHFNATDSLGSNNIIDNNLFDQWKEAGTNAVSKDPLISPDDFRFRFDSPAIGMGIEQINTEDIGLPIDFRWAELTGQPVDRIWLNQSAVQSDVPGLIDLKVGESLDLKVTGRNEDGYVIAIPQQSITYSVEGVIGSDPSVVNVDGSGKLQALDAGIVKVTAIVTLNGSTRKSAVYVTVRDLNPPVTTAQLTPDSAAGLNGWFVKPVNVVLSATDDAKRPPATTYSLDGMNWQPYTQPVPFTVDGDYTLHYRSIDMAGNTEAAKSLAIKLDQTKPTVTFSVYEGAVFHVDQIVQISCSATDVTSGIASSSCPSLNQPAYQLALGANTYTGTAVDQAGNAESSVLHYTIAVDFSSLLRLTQAFVTKEDVAVSLADKLQAAAVSQESGNPTARNNQLSAYQHLLSAQSGKALTSEKAAILQQYADVLKQ
ncbi:OmpL47-type beta-barrel domain-containing protein [Paenibacillus roseipurpureus]|uniref:Cadherin-like beta sandwich domain-containing protein n=1 Tax=Paenibacillus roseopurpureus TaxID=2918901 RepID=A0AA96LP05_9BACL|nr:cadherin-like beta sandwich domain-containing protein [Paenibacillus sp. MBLB1832]WNR45285.1 cadherin-like beta sandwich domain-containing protein [Paenibacillus sp. MBLB1832]